MRFDDGIFGLYSRLYENRREVEYSLEDYLRACSDDPSFYAGAAGGDEAKAPGRAWRNADRRNAMNLWHTDCVLQVSRTFDSGLRSCRDAASVRGREIGSANAPHDGKSNFLSARSFTD